MLLPLDGPTLQLAVSVTTGAVVEAKVGASTQVERKVVDLHPVSGRIYYYISADGSTPSTGTVSANGIVVYCRETKTIEIGVQKVFMLAVSATTNVIVTERG